MADNGTDNSQEQSAANDEKQTKTMSVIGQYIKDVSFENPRSPQVLYNAQNQRPDIDVKVDVAARKINEEEGHYEVEVSVNATAKEENGETVFIAEVVYAGLFVAKNLPANELEPALLVYSPGLLFPYLRRILSDLTRDGGFPPLLLDPIDFGRLYAHNRAQNLHQKQKEHFDKQASDAGKEEGAA